MSHALFSQQPTPKDPTPRGIHVFHPDIDDLFGPLGVEVGKLTDFAGLPGSGRTQITAHLAAHASLPQILGGLGGETLYIDTRGAMTQRYCEGAFSGVRQKLQAILESNSIEVTDEERAAAKEYVEKFDAGGAAACHFVHHYEVTTFVSLMATMTALPLLLQNNPNIRLIVVNGYPMEDYPLRSNFLDPVNETEVQIMAESEAFERTAALCNTTRGLLSTAITNGCAAVYCTNLESRGDIFVPMDGQWTKMMHKRFFLRHTEGEVFSIQEIEPAVFPLKEDDSVRAEEKHKRWLERKLWKSRNVSFVMTANGIEEVVQEEDER